MINKRFFIKYISFLVFFINCECIPSLAQTLEQREIPSNNLAYPVLIQIPDHGLATGFYFRNDKHLYLVTAKHVLFTNECKLNGTRANCLSYPEDVNVAEPIIITIDTNSCKNQELIKYHNTHDAAIIQIGDIIIKDSNSPAQIRFHKEVTSPESELKYNLVVAHIEGTKAFNDVLISNDVFIFGYPTSIGIKKDPQFDYLRPLLRKGIVAGKNLKKETIIIDCPTYYGNSGGPVIEVDPVGLTETRFMLIGLLSEFIPYTEIWENKTNKLTHEEWSNSGYSVVTPINKVLELISQYDEFTKPITEPNKVEKSASD